MKKSTPRNWSTGKARRVSHQRELAVVTLAAVASISGVGGLLAVGKQASAPVRSASVSRSPLPGPAQPRPAHKPLALRQPTYKGEGGEGARDDGQVIRRPARKFGPGGRRQAVYGGDDGEEAGDEGGAILQPAKKAHPRRNGNFTWSPPRHTRPSAVSRGSAPVN
jgi:hypothetical protein